MCTAQTVWFRGGFAVVSRAVLRRFRADIARFRARFAGDIARFRADFAVVSRRPAGEGGTACVVFTYALITDAETQP